MKEDDLFPEGYVQEKFCEVCIFCNFDCVPSLDHSGYIKCPFVYGFESSIK